MSVDLVYRMNRSQTYDVDDNGFFLVDSLCSAIHRLPTMWRGRGAIGTAKLVAKVVLGRCWYFGLMQDGELRSSGVLALGHCRFYPVTPDAIVIGEVATPPASRGKGFATRTVMVAVNWMIGRGSTVFYIDTQRQNTPMIRSIEKLGFGPPIGGDAAGITP